MRFPTKLLAANVWITLIVASGFVPFVALVAAGVSVFGEVTQSAWEIAIQVARWYALFVGVALVREFLPLYLAHGRTRRQFSAEAAAMIPLFAAFLSVLTVLGYLIENPLYDLVGWPQDLANEHLFTAPTQAPLVFVEHVVEFSVWTVSGGFIAAGCYRFDGGGLLTVPIGIALVLLTQGVAGDGLRVPFLGNVLDLGVTPSVPLVVGVGLGALLVGFGVAWAIIRDMPLQNTQN